MRVHAVVQARMGSTRLPGKVLRLLGGRPVLSWVVDAAQRAPGVDDVIVATSDEPEDDPVAHLAAATGAQVVRGSEHDVLTRFVQALDEHPCDAVVRLTADCPLLDAGLIGQVVAAWRADATVDYLATTLVRTLPRGLDVELVRAAVLRDVAHDAVGHDRIHVTSGVYARSDRYSLMGLVVDPPAADLRVTLDTAEDAALLGAVVHGLGGEPPTWRSVVRYLREHPDVAGLNSGVRQKQVEEG